MPITLDQVPRLALKGLESRTEELEAAGKTVRFYLAGKKGRVLRRLYQTQVATDYELGGIKKIGVSDAQGLAQYLGARVGAGEFGVDATGFGAGAGAGFGVAAGVGAVAADGCAGSTAGAAALSTPPAPGRTPAGAGSRPIGCRKLTGAERSFCSRK